MMVTLRLNPKPASLTGHELGAIRSLLDAYLSEELSPTVLDYIYCARFSVAQAMLELSGCSEVIQ